MALTDQIKKQFPKANIVETFQVPYVGWELDYDFAVVENEGCYEIFGTDHGRLVKYKKKEIRSMLTEMEKTISNARRVLSLSYLKG